MTDKAFICKTLGRDEPWEVADVSLDLGGKRVAGDAARACGDRVV